MHADNFPYMTISSLSSDIYIWMGLGWGILPGNMRLGRRGSVRYFLLKITLYTTLFSARAVNTEKFPYPVANINLAACGQRDSTFRDKGELHLSIISGKLHNR